MPDSCRERIVSAIETVLQGVAGVTVERNREAEIGDDDVPRLVLFERDDEIPRNDFSSMDVYDLPLVVQGAVVGHDKDGAKAANAQRAALMSALLANRSLGGLARNIELTSAGDVMGCPIVSSSITGFMLAFVVAYATREGDTFTFENE